MQNRRGVRVADESRPSTEFSHIGLELQAQPRFFHKEPVAQRFPETDTAKAKAQRITGLILMPPKNEPTPAWDQTEDVAREQSPLTPAGGLRASER